MCPGKKKPSPSRSRHNPPWRKNLLVTWVQNNIPCVTNLFAKDFRGASLLGATLALLLLTCGCSSFNREWHSVGKQIAPQDALVGRWEGRWLSDVNGHNGKLRCLINHQTNDIYVARFRATYWKLFRFSSTVPLQVTPQETGWRFQGEVDLGKLSGGVYRYDGSATQTDFHSTYHSKYDHGIFEMRRIPAAPTARD